ncbi:MAG: glycoside hydrolase family 16 protein [Ruminococcus sp.]|nr:glycoside hydrolase family 16 protein [Candidatus Copronaster equi]
MKKVLKIVLSFVLCFTFLFATATPALVTEASANNTTIEVPAEFQNAFDKLSNVVIDVVHRFLMALRYPWEPKTPNTVDMSKFTLVFDEEFDDDEIDMNVWNHYRQGERKGGYWDKDQAFICDGNLVIKTDYKENGKYGSGYYCDRIDTRDKYTQTYGYFECRCILPAAQGLWSAFWLSNKDVSIDGTPGTKGTEIDVFESPLYYRTLLGLDNSMITSNLHYGGYGLQTKYKNVTISKAINPYTQFNTYGLEWNEDEYIFYINGVETGRSKFGGVSKAPEYLILSCEVDGVDGVPFYGWSGLITKNKKHELPAEFIVDYVRAYQYTDLLEK